MTKHEHAEVEWIHIVIQGKWEWFNLYKKPPTNTNYSILMHSTPKITVPLRVHEGKKKIKTLLRYFHS